MGKRNRRNKHKKQYTRPEAAFETASFLFSDWVRGEAVTDLLRQDMLLTDKAADISGRVEFSIRTSPDLPGFDVNIKQDGHVLGHMCWKVEIPEFRHTSLIMTTKSIKELLLFKFGLALPLFWYLVRMGDWVYEDGWILCNGVKLFTEDTDLRKVNILETVQDKVGLDKGFVTTKEDQAYLKKMSHLEEVISDVMQESEGDGPLDVLGYLQCLRKNAQGILFTPTQALVYERNSETAKRTRPLLNFPWKNWINKDSLDVARSLNQAGATWSNIEAVLKGKAPAPKKHLHMSMVRNLISFLDRVTSVMDAAQSVASGSEFSVLPVVMNFYEKHRENRKPVFFIREQVSKEFLHADAMPVTPRPMPWGSTAYIQFENFWLDEDAVAGVNTNAFTTISGEDFIEKKVTKVKVDGFYISLVEDKVAPTFSSLSGEAAFVKESQEMIDNINGLVSAGELLDDMIVRHGGTKTTVMAWDLMYAVQVYFENDETLVTIWQAHTLFPTENNRYSIMNGDINTHMGKLANRDIVRVTTTFLYAIDRERIVSLETRRSKPSRGVRRSRKGQKSYGSRPSYSIVKLDTEHKAKIRYVYDRDKSSPPAYKVKGHERNGTYAKVWVKEENLFEQDTVDKIQVRSSTGTKLYRVTRWRSSATVNGGSTEKGTVEVRSWVPKK